MNADAILGLIGALGWLAILAHAAIRPAHRFWPPRQPSWRSTLWSWSLTTIIYVSLFRLGTSQPELRALPVFLAPIGVVIAALGSIYQSWATNALGLKATSGWPLGGTYPAKRCTKGPYKHMAHPQYFGQGLSFVGLTMLGGTATCIAISAVGCIALMCASAIEHQHLQPKPMPAD